jgi:hypothetical protein
LERGLQFAAEKELQWQLSRLKGDRGTIIVMGMHNGEILALASSPSWDPSHYSDHPREVLANVALQDRFEPAIILPLLQWLAHEAAAAAGAALSDTIAEGDTAAASIGRRSESARDLPWQWKPLAHGLYVWSPWTGEELTTPRFPDNLLHSLWTLGLGQSTGIDLPGESPGRLPPAAAVSWEALSHQGLRANPVQILRGFTALVNSGKLVHPHVTLDKTGGRRPDLWKMGSHRGLEGTKERKDLTGDLREKLAVKRGPSMACLLWKGDAEMPGDSAPAQVTALGFWPPDTPKVSYVVALDGVRRDPREYRGTLGNTIDLARAGALMPMDQGGKGADLVEQAAVEGAQGKTNFSSKTI